MSQGDRKSTSAVCPYWESKDLHNIYCEGPVEGSRLRLSFAVPATKQYYSRNYCCARWKDCMIARMLETKWQEFFEGENND